MSPCHINSGNLVNEETDCYCSATLLCIIFSSPVDFTRHYNPNFSVSCTAGHLLLTVNVLLPLQLSLSGRRSYDPTFSDSRTKRMSGLTCGVCSNPPSCVEPSAQADQCIMCTVPGLAPATNYTVSVATLSDAGTGASSEERTEQTDAQSKLSTL